MNPLNGKGNGKMYVTLFVDLLNMHIINVVISKKRLQAKHGKQDRQTTQNIRQETQENNPVIRGYSKIDVI